MLQSVPHTGAPVLRIAFTKNATEPVSRLNPLEARGHLGSSITPRPRYLRIEQLEGLPVRTQISFSAHVHLGMSSGEEAISMMNELRAYLPLLRAVSANSPFWRGYDTGHACYRQRILAASTPGPRGKPVSVASG